jgi:hypothetical protein
MTSSPEKQAEMSACAECGMADVGNEYHPYVLCLLVKARGGDTTAARKDLVSVIDVARSEDSWLRSRVDALLKAVSKGA